MGWGTTPSYFRVADAKMLRQALQVIPDPEPKRLKRKSEIAGSVALLAPFQWLSTRGMYTGTRTEEALANPNTAQGLVYTISGPSSLQVFLIEDQAILIGEFIGVTAGYAQSGKPPKDWTQTLNWRGSETVVVGLLRKLESASRL